MLIIHGAHNMGVTAIAGTRNCKRIISGGGTGMVSEKGALKTHQFHQYHMRGNRWES